MLLHGQKMKKGSIKLPVGERETDKRENGSIYRWAIGHFPTSTEMWSRVCDKSHCNSMPATITFNGVFIISIKATSHPYRIFHQCTHIGKFCFSREHKAWCAHVGFSDKAEKILGRKGHNHWLLFMFDWNHPDYHYLSTLFVVVLEDYS